MKWLLILAFLTFDEHAGEFIYSAGKPWTAIFDTRAECLKARDEAVNFTLKWQRTERNGETSAESICIKQHYPVAASLPPGMQRPSHGGPHGRAIIKPQMEWFFVVVHLLSVAPITPAPMPEVDDMRHWE